MDKRKIAAVLMALILAGCGRRERPPRPAPTQTAPQETTQAPAQIPEPTPQPTETAEPTAVTVPLEEPPEEAFVRVLTWIPDMYQDLRYAGTNNFTGEQIYPFYDGYLRYGTVKKLRQVNDDLAQQGYALLLWDGYRPASAQHKLWQICPDPNFVANPVNGFSNHTRGNTVDVTLVDSSGQELDMPSGFDEFSEKANRNYSDCSELQAANAALLETVMQRYGFTGYFGEWWHYTDTQSYPIEQQFEPPLG